MRPRVRRWKRVKVMQAGSRCDESAKIKRRVQTRGPATNSENKKGGDEPALFEGCFSQTVIRRLEEPRQEPKELLAW